MSDYLRPITLDVDGVLLDYHEAYARLWARVFGTYPAIVDKHAYSVRNRYDVRTLVGDELAHFNSFKDQEFWTTMNPIDGALDACYRLKELFPGVKLIAVSALPMEAQEWRKQNLLDLKFPIDECHATGRAMETPTAGPKSFLLNRIKPRYHVEDHLPYFLGVDPEIRRVLIHRNAHDRRSHNHDPLMLAKTHARHKDLKDWVTYLAKSLENPA